jgi:hypothetical protein
VHCIEVPVPSQEIELSGNDVFRECVEFANFHVYVVLHFYDKMCSY